MKKNIIQIGLIAIGIFILLNWHSILLLFTLDKGIQQFDKNYPEKDYQYKASLMLKDLGVRHKIDHEGILRYNWKDQEIVEGVYDKISKQHTPDWPNIRWADENMKNQLIEFLVTNKIPYKIRKLDSSGGDYILWPPEFDQIVEKYNQEILQHLKNTEQSI